VETWVPLRDFPGYSLSDEGRVRNDRFNKLRTINHQGGYANVAFFKNGRLSKRTLAYLVAQEFVQRPREHFNSLIYLDGDRRNCKASNLAWRPRWFALRHARQFSLTLPDYPDKVRNIDTLQVYDTVWDVVFDKGVIYNDVVLSILNRTYVFPLFQSFEWVI
jgi:hypothetical protein